MPNPTSHFIPVQGSKSVLGDTIRELVASHNSALGSAQTLTTQMKFSGNLLLTLPADQAMAVDDATQYEQGWNHGVSNVFVQGLSSISVFMSAILKSLEETAKQLDTAEPGSDEQKTALQDMREIIITIIDSACAVDPDTQSYLLSMVQMGSHLKLLADNSRRDALRLQADSAVIDQLGVIKKLEERQLSLQDELSGVNQEMAGRALKELSGEVVFGITIGSKFANGLNPGAVMGSAVTIVGEGNEIKKFQEDTKALRDQQDTLFEEMSALNSAIEQDIIERMELTLTTAQIIVFQENVNNVDNLGRSIIDQFTNWKQRLKRLQDIDPDTAEAGYYTSQVVDGFNFWKALGVQLDGYQKLDITGAS